MAATSGKVLLVGAGHAHLHLLLNAPRLHKAGAEVTLLAPSRFWYSGLVTGMLGGQFAPAEDTVDVAALAARAGVEHVAGRMAALDLREQSVTTEAGEVLRYDLLSLNIGSRTALADIPGAVEHAVPVKPLERLAELRATLEERFERRQPTSVAVIGGGASGCEVAANIAALAAQHHAACEVTLLSQAQRLLPQWPKGASTSLQRALEQRGVVLRLGAAVSEVRADGVLLESSAFIPADFVVTATGLEAPEVLQHAPLQSSAEGVAVRATLQTAGREEVFAAGDCANFLPRALPKIGVFGVRQAPVLLRNLCALLEGRPFEDYRPQRRFLSILNLGEGEGLALWGPLHWRGHTSLWLKNRLDLRFLSQFHHPK